MFDKFSDRHIGVTNPEDLKAMLAVIGVKSVDELIAQVIPQSIRLKQPLALPQGMSEYEFANHIQALAAKNRTLRSFIGMGYYPCAVPAACSATPLDVCASRVYWRMVDRMVGSSLARVIFPSGMSAEMFFPFAVILMVSVEENVYVSINLLRDTFCLVPSASSSTKLSPSR